MDVSQGGSLTDPGDAAHEMITTAGAEAPQWGVEDG
jgi:hypothetical protein